MKNYSITFFCLCLLASCMVMESQAGVPLPSVTYFGSVRNPYGYPYNKNAEVVLFKGSVECVRFLTTGERSHGMNYRLDLEMDSGGVPYEPYAAQVGDVIGLKVYDQGQPMAIMPNAYLSSTSTLTVPDAGKNVRLDIQTGTDSDDDGLPDAWERLLIAMSGGALKTLADVRPEDDFDGDGSSNLHEFQSGTFPWLANDCFAMDDLEHDANGRFSFSFLAVDGFVYEVLASTNLTSGVWNKQLFASTPTAPVEPGYILGDDTFKTIYVEATNAVEFIRLTIK